MVPSIGIMEIALILVVLVVIVLGSFLVVRLVRGVPSKSDRKKQP